MEEILLDFPEEIRRILKDLTDSEYADLILHPKGKDLVVESCYDLCYSWKLTFMDISGLPEQAEDGWTFWCSDLSRDGDRYLLKGGTECLDTEESLDVELRFSDLSAAFDVHRADVAQAGVKPWTGLAALAYGIVRKNEVVPQLMNGQELALLPLLGEIAALGGWQGADQAAFPLLRQRLHPKLHRFLDQMEQSDGNWKKYRKAENKLLSQLNRSEYEPVWREIYNKAAASQAEYPLRTCVSADLRRKIETMLHCRGYSGKYPDFIKTGEVRGLHVRDSYGMSYFIFNEKRGVFHIRCREYPGWQDAVRIEFLCGTEFLKRDEQPGDIWSCMFEAKGRRLIHSISCFEEEDLPMKVTVAVKKAELQKLTKAERKAEGSANLLSMFLLFFLIAGGLFAVFMTIGFGLLSMLITGILVGWAEIPEMVSAMPWLDLFLMSWIGFGGAMGVVCVMAERNK